MRKTQHAVAGFEDREREPYGKVYGQPPGEENDLTWQPEWNQEL